MSYFAGLSQNAIDLDVYQNKGYEYLYSSKDSSYFYFEKALEGYRQVADADNQFASFLGLLYANGYYYDLKSLKLNLSRFEKHIYSGAFRNSEYKGFIRDRLFLEQINYYFKISNHQVAQRYIDSLKKFQEQRPAQKRDKDYYEIGMSAGLYQGSIYTNQSKLNLALDKYKQLQGFIETHKDSLYDPKNAIFSIKRLTSKVYTGLGDLNRAILSQLEALEIIKDDRTYINSLIDLQLDITTTLIESKELKDAEHLIAILDSQKIEKPNFRIRLLDQKRTLALALNRKSSNLEYHKAKLKELKNYRELSSHPDRIYAHIDYAADSHYWGDTQDAVAQLEKARDLLADAASAKESLSISKIRLDLASRYLKIYRTIRTDTVAREVLDLTKEVAQSLDILQPQFESTLDKQYLINKAYPALKDAFVLLYDLYQFTGEAIYLEQAFVISEKSKAITLRAMRQVAIAQNTLNISPQIIEQENIFNVTINQLEKDLFTNQENTQALSDSLLSQKEAYGDFIQQLRFDHPDYYELRYQNDIINLSQAKDLLPEKSVVLSFFEVDEMLYVFNIDEKEVDVHRIPFDAQIQQKIRDYYTNISAFDVANYKQHEQLGKELYKLLILSNFKNELPETLTIIPDGLLHYIPFGALKYGEDYLIQTTTVSYKHAVSLLPEKNKNNHIAASFYGFAPHYKGSTAFVDLLFNEVEITRASNYFQGNTFMKEEASLERFRESVRQNNQKQNNPIYHLATHAVANDTLPEYSYLAFTPKDQKDDFILYAKDLYGEKLNCAMVILSACETGLGKIENGQGMQSLAQGFNYAGASSLVYSKWKVSDRHTADLMGLFYEYLDQGLPKDKALQQAKVDYLVKTDDPYLSHPYYWASFVFSGDATPLQTYGKKWFWIFGLLLLVALIAIVVKKKCIQ